MSKFKVFIGIDISKYTFDATKMLSGNLGKSEHKAFKQTRQGLRDFIAWASSDCEEESQVLICMEHTGLYIHGILEALTGHHFFVWVEMALRIKRSIGLQRGGDDKLASMQIAQYAYRYQDVSKRWIAEDIFIQKLRHYTAQRQRMIVAINQLEVPVRELGEIGCKEIAKELSKQQSKVISMLQRAIVNIEHEIQRLIKKIQQLNR